MHLRLPHPGRLLAECTALTGLLIAIAVPSAWAAPPVTEFTTPSNSDPLGITAGPDGNVWFVENGTNSIGRVTPAGVLAHFVVAGGNPGLADITSGPDGNLWLTENSADKVAKMTPAGAILASYAVHSPLSITRGPDGNLWFTEPGADKIGRVTTSGSFVEYSIPGSGNQPWGIVAGSDGNLWFTESGTSGIARITTAGVVTEYPLSPGGVPTGIALGPDGNVWFADGGSPGSIGRITPAGTITRFSAGLTAGRSPRDIAAGADGNLYFTESASGGDLGQITTAGVITEFSSGLTHAPWDIAAGPDGNLWFTEWTGLRVGRLGLAPGASTDAATFVHSADATLGGIVTPRSQVTTYHFDWGLTTSYGSSTAETAAGSGAPALAVKAILTGLAPATAYHYRIAATSPGGTTLGADQTFTTLAAPFAAPPVVAPVVGLPPATRPVFGRSATISTLSGTVQVQLPGSDAYLPLSAASTVPVGTTIDATAGMLKLTNVKDRSGKLQTGRFWGGAFTVHQARKKHAATVLRLVGPTICTKARRLAFVAAIKPAASKLWGKDNNGRFVTRGRTAVATVRGTTWLTSDGCAGTLVRVTKGTVSVRDLVQKRTVVVRAGHRYLARAG